MEQDEARDYEERRRYEEKKAIDTEMVGYFKSMAEQSAKRTQLQESSNASLSQLTNALIKNLNK